MMPAWFWLIVGFWAFFYLGSCMYAERWIWPGSKRADCNRKLRQRYDAQHKLHLESCYRAVTDGEYKWLMRMGWQPEGEAIRRTYHHHGYTEGVSLDPDVIYLPDGTEVGKGELFPMPAMESADLAENFAKITREVREITARRTPATPPDTIVHPREGDLQLSHSGVISCSRCTPEHIAWAKERGRHV